MGELAVERDAGLALGQPVKFSHVLHRASEWVERKGTARTWKPSLFEAEGFIVGWRTLSNGIIEEVRESDGYGYSIHVANEWRGSDYFRAYLVTYDLRCDPVFVLPEHIRAIPPVEGDTIE